jgi:hypothetical protein
MVCFVMALPLYKKLSIRPASPVLVERTKKAVEKNPQLQADWDRAIKEDGVLTWPKANAILEKSVRRPIRRIDRCQSRAVHPSFATQHAGP